MSNAAADMAMKAKTPHPSGNSPILVIEGSVPGGPAMYVATTGKAKSLESTAMTTAWAASTRPTITFHQRRLRKRPSRSWASPAASRVLSEAAMCTNPLGS